MDVESRRRSIVWRSLSLGMILVSGGAVLWALIAVRLQPDPLNSLLIWLVLVPAAFPLLLAVFMWKRQRWALIGLRGYLVCLLAAGAILQLMGMGVFSFPPFAIPFVGFCLGWLLLSLRC